MVGLGILGTRSDETTTAWGVSADGSVIAGVSRSDLGVEAFRWTAETGMVGLGDLAGGEFHSEAKAISSDGQVIVGQSTSALGKEAFRWTAAGGMQGLGDLPGGDFLSTAWATTADGQIVVGESASSPLGLEAFIWDATHGMRRLYDVLEAEFGLADELAGWKLAQASDISDDGRVIVGYGFNPDGAISGFAVVIPEPRSLALALCGGAILMTKRIRRQRTHA
jgi:probable HAF family extracellular repeat protein